MAAAADVGGVGAPVSTGDFLPLDGGLDVDAEGLGQDRGRDVSGQGEQGGAATLARADPEGMQPLAESVFGQRASWPASREQPGGRDTEQAGARYLAAARERADQGVQRGGQHDGPAAQAQERAAVLIQDMLSRQGCDDTELASLPNYAVGTAVKHEDLPALQILCPDPGTTRWLAKALDVPGEQRRRALAVIQAIDELRTGSHLGLGTRALKLPPVRHSAAVSRVIGLPLVRLETCLRHT